MKHIRKSPCFKANFFSRLFASIFSYGRLAIKNSFDLHERFSRWGFATDGDQMCGDEFQFTRINMSVKTSMMSLFNWLNAQAHCAGSFFKSLLDRKDSIELTRSATRNLRLAAHILGYTQYTDDFDKPFSSQLILSDGHFFDFSVYQLRTLAFNIDPECECKFLCFSHIFAFCRDREQTKQ